MTRGIRLVSSLWTWEVETDARSDEQTIVTADAESEAVL